MKTTGATSAALLLALILVACGLGTARATAIDENLADRLAAYIVAAPAGVDRKAEYALAVLKLWDERTPAERTAAGAYLDEICNLENPLSPTGSNAEVAIWFQIPQLARMLLDPAINDGEKLTESNLNNIRRVLWQFINPRCTLAEADGDVWLTRFGENKSVIEKATCLLGSMALLPDGDGYDDDLANGGSLEEHVKAWKEHFYEYFRQRAREGLMCEIATGYNNITGGIWCVVRDMMDPEIGDEPELQKLADQAITLFWADYVTDFSPTLRIRAIASSRIYKSSVDAIGADPFRSLTWAYGWHGQKVGPAPGLSYWMASNYRPPLVNSQDILQNIAVDDDRPPYLSTTRRLGRGQAGGTLKFGPNHSSDVRRDLWYTRNYVLGALTLKTDNTGYMDSGGPSLDRTVGLVFSNASERASRIVFYGSGDDTGDDHTPGDPQAWVGKREINSIGGERCLVTGRDPQSNREWVKLFISNGELRNNRQDQWGWIFTRTTGLHNDVFVAIRITEGGSTTQPTYASNGAESGYALRFNDGNAPMVIEVANSAQYSGPTGFDDFKSACQWNWALHPAFYGIPAYDPATKKVDYHSLAGDRYEFWSNSAILPRKNGADLNLNPAKTYHGPYLNGDHGRDFVTIGDGVDAAILDFNFTAVPRRDDYQTLALWHMDAIAAGKIPDDDTEVLNRNRDLTLIGGPTVVADTNPGNGYRGDVFGKALHLNGENYGKAGNWPSLDNMVIDFWFKPDRDVGFNQTLASASNIWELRLEGTNIRFFTWDAAGAVRSRTATGAGTKDVWHHIHAEISNVSGQMSLTVDGVTQATSTGNNMKTASAPIEVGFKSGTTRYFAGRIDDVKIRRWSDQ
jgi:hypothetical protein